MRFLHVPGVVDLTGPRGDGQLTVAAAGRLFLLGTSGQPVPFARGSGGYTTANYDSNTGSYYGSNSGSWYGSDSSGNYYGGDSSGNTYGGNSYDGSYYDNSGG